MIRLKVHCCVHWTDWRREILVKRIRSVAVLCAHQQQTEGQSFLGNRRFINITFLGLSLWLIHCGSIHESSLRLFYSFTTALTKNHRGRKHTWQTRKGNSEQKNWKNIKACHAKSASGRSAVQISLDTTPDLRSLAWVRIHAVTSRSSSTLSVRQLPDWWWNGSQNSQFNRQQFISEITQGHYELLKYTNEMMLKKKVQNSTLLFNHQKE